MRFGSWWVVGLACLTVAAAAGGCGGKVIESGEDAGSGGTEVGGSGGSGGTDVGGSGGVGGMGGSGGLPSGGSGGMPAGGSGGMPSGGSGGMPAGGSGGMPAGGSGGAPTGGSGGMPAGSGGGPGGSGGYAGGACWNLVPPTTPCRECMDSYCCGEIINCFEDPTGQCPQELFCFEECTDPDPTECAIACDNGNFNIPFNDVFTCGQMNCEGVCTNVVPPPPMCPVQSGDPACDDCINGQCGAECNACVNNDACISLLECISYCSDDACQQQCFNQYPGGIDDLMAFLGYDGCLATHCSAPCGF